MDDASRRIVDLQRKLGELDGKVAAYRSDMAAEFRRYSEDVLRDVPESVASEVQRAVAVSLSRFTSLYPDASGVRDVPRTLMIDRSRWTGPDPSSPPALHPASGSVAATSGAVDGVPDGVGSGRSSPPDKPRDPHAREKEFHGLFTPSYLPLLDGSDRPPVRSPPVSPPPVTAASFDGNTEPKTDHHAPLSASTDPSDSTSGVGVGSGTGTGSGMIPRFPPVRRFTDPPADSGSGETRVRRSALRRRSSSSNRTSPGPRRVRFDFEGQEVLPSSSPQTSLATAVNVGQPPAARTIAAVTEADDPLSSSSSSAASPSDSPAPPKPQQQKSTLPAYLLDEFEEDENPPPPKKVSSSQALRALSKLPLEDPSAWTVVNASPDPAEPFLRTTRPQTQPPPPPQPVASPPTNHNLSLRIPSHPDLDEEIGNDIRNRRHPLSTAQGILGSPLQDLEAYEDDGSASEDDYISMPLRSPRKKSVSPESQSPAMSVAASAAVPAQSAAMSGARPTSNLATTTAQSIESAPSAAAAKSSAVVTAKVNGNLDKPSRQPDKHSQKTKAGEDDDDDEDLFDFDGDSDGTQKGRKPKPYLEEEEESVSEAEGDADAAGRYTTTSATTREIMAAPTSASQPVQEPSSPAPPASVGSYKGRHITFDVVKDPVVHQKATELGRFNTFVGSVHDRDSGNILPPASFRGGSISREHLLSGTPRSLTERFILENFDEEEVTPTLG